MIPAYKLTRMKQGTNGYADRNLRQLTFRDVHPRVGMQALIAVRMEAAVDVVTAALDGVHGRFRAAG